MNRYIIVLMFSFLNKMPQYVTMFESLATFLNEDFLLNKVDSL